MSIRRLLSSDFKYTRSWVPNPFDGHRVPRSRRVRVNMVLTPGGPSVGWDPKYKFPLFLVTRFRNFL